MYVTKFGLQWNYRLKIYQFILKCVIFRTNFFCMNLNFLSNFWENPRYILYTKIIGAFASGCTCIVFLNSNQIQYLKDRNEDLGKTYELNRELYFVSTIPRICQQSTLLEPYMVNTKYNSVFVFKK